MAIAGPRGPASRRAFGSGETLVREDPVVVGRASRSDDLGRAARRQTRAFPFLCARGAARPCPAVRPSLAEVGLGVRAW